MTTLYKPVKITSVEQADALPKGTFVRLGFMSDSWSRLLAPEDRDSHDADDVPFLALVPIEAEEEWGEDDDADSYTPTRRLVTPWQKADQ